MSPEFQHASNLQTSVSTWQHSMCPPAIKWGTKAEPSFPFITALCIHLHGHSLFFLNNLYNMDMYMFTLDFIYLYVCIIYLLLWQHCDATLMPIKLIWIEKIEREREREREREEWTFLIFAIQPWWKITHSCNILKQLHLCHATAKCIALLDGNTLEKETLLTKSFPWTNS